MDDAKKLDAQCEGTPEPPGIIAKILGMMGIKDGAVIPVDVTVSPVTVKPKVRPVMIFPIGGKRFGFLSPCPCGCEGCALLGEIARKN